MNTLCKRRVFRATKADRHPVLPASRDGSTAGKDACRHRQTDGLEARTERKVSSWTRASDGKFQRRLMERLCQCNGEIRGRMVGGWRTGTQPSAGGKRNTDFCDSSLLTTQLTKAVRGADKVWRARREVHINQLVLEGMCKVCGSSRPSMWCGEICR